MHTHADIRLCEKIDQHFVIHGWLESHKHAHPDTPTTAYYDIHRNIVYGLVHHGHTYVLCDKEDPTHLYGFACCTSLPGLTLLHYIYIKSTFRSMGFAHTLLAHVRATHSNNIVITTKNPERRMSRMFVYIPHVELMLADGIHQHPVLDRVRDYTQGQKYGQAGLRDAAGGRGELATG